MDPFVTGSVVSGVLGFLGARRQNRSAQQIAREQMAFQERMSNTAHQREVADLRAAGLNPILSAMGGSGASSPGGASAPVVNEYGSATEGASAAAGLRILRQQEKKLFAETNKAEYDASASRAASDIAQLDAKVLEDLVRLGVPQASAKAMMEAQQFQLGPLKLQDEISRSEAARVAGYLNLFAPSVNAAGGLISNVGGVGNNLIRNILLGERTLPGRGVLRR